MPSFSPVVNEFPSPRGIFGDSEEHKKKGPIMSHETAISQVQSQNSGTQYGSFFNSLEPPHATSRLKKLSPRSQGVILQDGGTSELSVPCHVTYQVTIGLIYSCLALLETPFDRLLHPPKAGHSQPKIKRQSIVPRGPCHL
ncbi:hypothetical protein CEXT_369071 [Caerostris extrusa]|uniref:Uncharacterized protein n=1 Tax=Caerostris extrusa TaxID=172846 RepID=A0AAV4YB53_CAEEX|nr:hypothetical protein CEXT_369071 [Caerostris extrusa]